MKIKMICALVCIYSFTLFAQADSVSLSADEIQMLVDKLGVKLLLSDNQKNDISQTLTIYSTELNSLRAKGNYSDESRTELVTSTNEKIQLILDNKQKIKFGILEEDCWETIKTEEND